MLKFLRKYGEATTITFGLRDPDGVALKTDAVCVDGDIVIMKDEAAEGNVDADFTDEGKGYSLAFTVAEMTAARIQGYIEDQGTPVWLGREFLIETYGHANAQFPYMNEGLMDRVLAGGTHNITDSAGRRIRNLQEFGDYEHDSVWLDSNNGSPGTTDYESGTINNKVDTIADANTIGASLNKSGRAIVEGSSITLAASQENQNLWGNNWTLALGGQSISGTHISGADVSGVCSGANEPEFHECSIHNVTIPPCAFKVCDMNGILTLPVGEVHLHGCSGESGLVLDYGAAVANTTIHATEFSGDLIIDNLGANGVDVLDIRGHGKMTLNASCVGGIINWDGHFTIVNNGSGVTINSDDISSNVDTLIAAFSGITSVANWFRAMFRSDTADATALAEINSGSGTYDEATDSNEGLKGQIDLISAGIIVVGAGGSVTPSYAEEGEPEDIVQGDVINKPRYVTGDQSAKTIFCGAKTTSGDTSYTVGLIQCTVGAYDADNDQTSYLIPFVADDTKTVTAGTYKGEAEVRDADGTSNPVTADRFDLNVIGEIVT